MELEDGRDVPAQCFEHKERKQLAQEDKDIKKVCWKQ